MKRLQFTFLLFPLREAFPQPCAFFDAIRKLCMFPDGVLGSYDLCFAEPPGQLAIGE